MIRLEVTGRLGKNGEMRQVGQKQAYCFSVAHDETRNGQRTTTWVNVVTYNVNSKIIQYLQKGAMVSVIGNQDLRIYTDKSGQNVIGITVYANAIDILQFPRTDNESVMNHPPQQNCQQAPSAMAPQMQPAIPPQQYQQPQQQQAQQYAADQQQSGQQGLDNLPF